MFRGTYFHSVDEKGRVAVPRKFRETLLAAQGDNRIVVTRSSDPSAPCLEIYPEPEWAALDERIRAMPQFADKTRQFKAFYIHPAQDMTLDAQGRMLLPVELRARIGLGDKDAREVVFTGDLEKFLLWSRSGWEQWETRNSDAAAQPGFFDELGL